MPITPTYPGVYIEEIPSGVRTITGVATSIAAFVGCAARGPVNEPVTITSFGDFERIFGGLWAKSRLGYAVRDFYQNGGTIAIIVRLVHPDAAAAAIPLSGGPPTLAAANEGDWGNALHAVVDNNVSADVANQFGLATADLFNLTVRDFNTEVTETFRNLTVKDSPRRIDRVLELESSLVRSTGTLTSVPTPNNPPAAGKTIWTDPNANTAATASSGHDGSTLDENDFDGAGKEAAKQGIYALLNTDIFNILCIPPYKVGDDVDTGLVGNAATLCEARRAMLVVDPPSSWTTVALAQSGVSTVGTNSRNAAVFFPRIKEPDLLLNGSLQTFVPCGAVAGIFARTDAQRGVWKAPAGLDATLVGVPELALGMTDLENGQLNPHGINCLRNLPAAGRVVWGSRTLQGDDRLASEWKYIPVRRLALYLEESLYRGTQWVVFEPNDEPLWAQIRLNVGAFMHGLFRQGAFQGKTPQEAYFVKCDKETTTQTDINNGVVNIVVGFAPLKPAEFVIIQIQQIAGQIQT
ncbi:MAG TPA: phage tail sheath C-terminal domain-containing protein [Nitrospira sp.]|nr:phage tail sheath C-terminal domain-containing protein [Nitrospira sp.]